MCIDIEAVERKTRDTTKQELMRRLTLTFIH